MQFEGPIGVQVALGGQFEAPSGVQVALGGNFEGPSEVQVALGGHSDGVQVRLGWPKRLQVGLQRRPRGAQDAPRGAQDAPRAAQDAPSWAPKTSKRGPRATKQQSKRNWTANSATLQKPWFSLGKLMILQVRKDSDRWKNELGRQVEATVNAKLACQSASWS